MAVGCIGLFEYCLVLTFVLKTKRDQPRGRTAKRRSRVADYIGYPGDSFVVWELLEQDDSTKLRLTTHVRESFPDDIPEFKTESCIAGWEYSIGKRLKEYLEDA
ncbi:MAG TPA: SRPBCC domain-containing protein [Acidobacteriota bacterium]|nr:SRPBCC domain-containing protein [Acidobacteriota bacterium]